ncbi:hypothetical protein GCM10010124_25940 [Pilimelia terevasa]|uniref:VRR-NUC domain-containing protein n=1 Tax=Pilimelia terevasa TaxID=53372 RepID=A0A8J3BRP0_9ACTN|nr:VRR-NUC domain-containing protein [Pilimelia terevasa]GGK31982.1 hypothetical protein GCM10010124_25940 [Pilimelia terevasa]
MSSRVLTAMSESTLQTAVLDLAARLHLRVAHFRPALVGGRWMTPVAADGAGWPDLVIVGARGVLYRELKAARGRLSAAQRTWLDALAEAGCDARVWTPDDWQDRRVLAEMAAIARRKPARP